MNGSSGDFPASSVRICPSGTLPSGSPRQANRSAGSRPISAASFRITARMSGSDVALAPTSSFLSRSSPPVSPAPIPEISSSSASGIFLSAMLWNTL